MTNDDKRALLAYIDAVLKMPAPGARVVADKIHDTENFIECAGCGKLTPAADMPTRHSGLLPFKDNICFGCQKEASKAKLAVVVCARCSKAGKRNVVRSRTYPSKDVDGFEFKPNGCYHLTRCPVCCEGIEKAEIAERLLWLRKNQLPLPETSSLILPP